MTIAILVVVAVGVFVANSSPFNGRFLPGVKGMRMQDCQMPAPTCYRDKIAVEPHGREVRRLLIPHRVNQACFVSFLKVVTNLNQYATEFGQVFGPRR